MFWGMDDASILFSQRTGAAELRRLARGESGRVCQRVLMIANMLEGMEHEEAARLAGLSRSAAYEWHNRYEEDGIEGLRDRPRPGRQPPAWSGPRGWRRERQHPDCRRRATSRSCSASAWGEPFQKPPVIPGTQDPSSVLAWSSFTRIVSGL